ncbi:WbqC family protein [Streptoalloteichus hindustanus]|nr:WbqC family protein [Streptoalloteichus hindustanus]
MTVVAPHQPAYLPWLGYLARAVEADVFLLLDHVQFCERGWQNRNRLLIGGRPRYLTVPVHRAGRFPQALNEVRVVDAEGWRRRHLRTLDAALGRGRHWEQVRDELVRPMLALESDLLVDITQVFFENCLRALGISCRVVRSSALELGGTRAAGMLVAAARQLGAARVVVGEGSRRYLGELPAVVDGVAIAVSRFRHPTYPQRESSRFVDALSCVDLLARVGVGEASRMLSESVSGEPSP